MRLSFAVLWNKSFWLIGYCLATFTLFYVINWWVHFYIRGNNVQIFKWVSVSSSSQKHFCMSRLLVKYSLNIDLHAFYAKISLLFHKAEIVTVIWQCLQKSLRDCQCALLRFSKRACPHCPAEPRLSSANWGSGHVTQRGLSGKLQTGTDNRSAHAAYAALSSSINTDVSSVYI